MRLMPQTVCQTSGSSTMTNEAPCATGFGYSVTAVCQAASPEKAARLFHRWTNVHAPRGRMARAEASRLLMKLAAAFDCDASVMVLSTTGVLSSSRQGWEPSRRPRLTQRLLELGVER